MTLTVDIDFDSLADCGRDLVGGDAEECAHVLPADLGQGHLLALPRRDLLLVAGANPPPNNEPEI